MIGTILNRSSRARDSKVRSLAFFLGFSVIVHGAFFPQEWLWLGAGLAFLLSWEAWSQARIHEFGESEETQRSFTITDGLLFTLTGLSLLGLLHPVRLYEGWMDAIRWSTLWMVYHQARKIREGSAQERMLSWVEHVGVFLAILAWLPQLSLWARGQGFFLTGTERLSSLFGYPNTLGVYMAAVLLLHPRSKAVWALLFLSLLDTGSRAAIVLFLIVWSTCRLMRWQVGGTFTNHFKREWVSLGPLIVSCLLLTIGLNPEAFQHLLDWRIQNSLGERFLYVQDGLKLAWAHQGIPQAGGWLAFPLVQEIPYWTTDPHSVFIRVLLNQGVYGLLAIILWAILILNQMGRVSQPTYSWISPGWDDRRLEIYSALLFLGLHAMMDADFLFGTLGILFWTLLGMLLSQQDRESFRFRFQKSKLNFFGSGTIFRNVYFTYLKNLSTGLFFFLWGLALLSTWVYPQWLNPQKGLEQEMLEVKGDKQRSVQVLQKGLAEDQTQFRVRREIASLELELHGGEGLGAVENVLAWEKFDVRAYEWVQGRVLDEAEKRRGTNPEEAITLYQWSEKLPSRLKKVGSVSTFERMLWPGAVNFQPSELMNLLASTARERQLTLR